MSLETVESEVEQRVRTLFEVPNGIPVDYGQPDFSKSNPWVRCTILGGLEVGLEISDVSRETSGTVEMQIFTKDKRPNAVIYDQLAALFRQQEFGGMRTSDPLRIVVGQSDGWWQTNLSVEWEIET